MTTKKAAKKKVSKKASKKVTKKAARKKAASKKTTSKKVTQKMLNPMDIPTDFVGEDWPWPLRPRQQVAKEKFDEGIKRQGLFWHRRAGKDVFCLSLARNQARKRVGGYVHFFPKHIQAKRAIWQGVDPKKGKRFVDIAFGDIEAHRNNAEMFIELYNGSTWQLLGSDNYDRIVGSNAVGVFFSEWALCDPRAWDFIRPIILENDGFAVFITTFRGRNHAWQMAQNLKNNPDWHIDIMPVDKSFDVDGNRIITDAMIENERRDGMSEALIQQEYYCNPEATADGAIYGSQVDALRHDSSRQFAVWNPSKPVYCVWNFDLPVFASYLMIQPGLVPQVLECGVHDFTTLSDSLAKVQGRRWPIMNHIISSEHRDLVGPLTDLGCRPEVAQIPFELAVNTHTESFIERMRLDLENAGDLLEALAGYVRREKFNLQTADLAFAPDPVMSWHWRLAHPLEVFAVWEYSSGDDWGPAPDYSTQDRAQKVVL